MMRNHLYYSFKPLLPRIVRVGVRRWFAQRRRKSVHDVWPILPGSERPPVGWRGWPDGKQFAFVLTHDVEGADGLQKVRQLAELEMSLGFRSSFNFIPEGEYQVTRSLREELTRNGFEVGVHDLHHDGKLYRNPREFAKKAVRINQYLHEWGAVGFRSGFMLRNLDWLLKLNVQYEASTFDTDPFEPQPDGAGTIFPFWVSNPNPNQDFNVIPRSSVRGAGYVELPYTLPQDSTLFRLLGEKTPEIWTNKLDWIAQHGGMALVNVHPDYMSFAGNCACSSFEFREQIYREFLLHVKNTYSERYWHVLPRTVASFVAGADFQRPVPLP